MSSLTVRVTKKKEKGVFSVKPVGSIDTETYTILEEKLKPILVPSTKALVFDMSGVEYVSSMGLSVIFKAKLKLTEQGATLAIVRKWIGNSLLAASASNNVRPKRLSASFPVSLTA